MFPNCTRNFFFFFFSFFSLFFIIITRIYALVPLVPPAKTRRLVCRGGNRLLWYYFIQTVILLTRVWCVFDCVESLSLMKRFPARQYKKKKRCLWEKSLNLKTPKKNWNSLVVSDSIGKGSWLKRICDRNWRSLNIKKAKAYSNLSSTSGLASGLGPGRVVIRAIAPEAAKSDNSAKYNLFDPLQVSRRVCVSTRAQHRNYAMRSGFFFF